MIRTTVKAVLLFLFIPLVLVLFLRQPIGPAASVLLGLVLMFGHRAVAAPWARRHALERCAWCAGMAKQELRPTPDGEPRPTRLDVESGGARWRLAACSASHAESVARFVTLLRRWHAPIALGIFVPLALLLAGTLAAVGGVEVLPRPVNALQFRVIVAATVMSASLGYLLVREPDARLRCPFPLHNLLLLGIRQTLWIFRIVGAWWLIDAVIRTF